MATKTMKLCKNTACFAAMRQELFPAKTTKCPYCQARLESVTIVSSAGKGSAKGGGKSDSGKSISRSSSGPTVGKKSRKKSVKKQVYKLGMMKDPALKPLSRKRTPRKPSPRKR
jgi:hypothetical protein